MSEQRSGAILGGMRYQLLDLEIGDDWGPAPSTPDQVGVGLLLRQDGRPISFAMHPHPPGARLSSAELERHAERDATEELLAQAIREQLVPAPPLEPVSVTIAVCTRGRGPLLERCLRRIVEVTRDESVEILIVDNGPADGSVEQLASELEGVRCTSEPRPGLDIARNRALREAGGDFVAYLDDDTLADREWLEGLKEALTENPDAAVVTGLVLPAELETAAQITFELRGGFRRGFSKLRFYGEELPGNPLYPLGAGMFGAGANMVVRREAALEIGGFDEALDTGAPLPGGGDLDIFFRMLRAGHPLVYEPRMLVFHHHRREMAALLRQYRSWGAGLMAYVGKTYESDPAMRVKLRGLVIWWVQYELRQILMNAVGRGWGRARFPLAELSGGIAGGVGGYRRSRKRIEAMTRRQS